MPLSIEGVRILKSCLRESGVSVDQVPQMGKSLSGYYQRFPSITVTGAAAASSGISPSIEKVAFPQWQAPAMGMVAPVGFATIGGLLSRFKEGGCDWGLRS